MDKTIAVIDGNSLMHRAYHAVPPAMTAPDGTPTNAVFGFLQMLIRFIEDQRPDAIVCAFDKGRPLFRMEAMEQYKAQRPPMDDALRVQFPVIERVLCALDIPVLSLPGWEGDDILGTIAARDERLGIRTLLVTGDKDAYQLATDLTRIVTTRKGMTDVVVYGPEQVEERYGVRPDQFRDFLGLMGDSSDNIPGVPGIGPKRATALLQKYGDMEGVYANLADFKGKQLENLRDNQEQAFLSRKVATIVTDVLLEDDIDLEAVHFPSFDPAEVTRVFEELRLRAQLPKMLAFAQRDGQGAAGSGTSNLGGQAGEGFEGDSGANGPSSVCDLRACEPFLTGVEAREAMDALLAAAGVGDGAHAPAHAAVNEGAAADAPDGEGTSVVSLAWSRDGQTSLFSSGLRIAVALDEGTALFEGEEATAALVAVLESNARFAAIDVKHLMEEVAPRDSSKPMLVDAQRLLDATFIDVALAAYVVDSNGSDYGIGALAGTYLGAVLPETDDVERMLAQEAAAVRELHPRVAQALAEGEAASVYEDIDAPLVPVLVLMERTGARVDEEHLARLKESADTRLAELEKQIFSLAGEEFNISSPKQLSHILFEVLGLTPGKKTRSGYSTNAAVLKELSKVHELPALVIEYREFSKLKGTYIDSLPRVVDPDDGRVHTSFNQMVTTTGRLSSSDPNLQNIPVRTEFGRKIRECFVPLRPGERYLSADYSQIELRLLAHLSGDQGLIEAFNSGADFHTRTASRVFDVPMDLVTPQLRSKAKAVNFGIVYGQQAFGLSQSLDIPFGEAKDMIERYFAAYPQVRTYLDDVVANAAETGYATTLFGRRRYVPEIASRNAAQRGFGERTAMNHPMQGTAADIIKLAMRQVQEAIVARGLESSLMLQVHDELDFSVPLAEVEELSALVKQVMESVVTLSVPLSVDVSLGDNWAQAH